jgi:kynurenine formamidase/ketosteroid isomerase-like protein
VTWFDLSVPLATGMPVYPGDPAVGISPALTVASHGANVLSLVLGSHSGTHVDAPLHVSDGGEPLDGLPMAQFTGLVELADVRGVGAGGIVTAEHLSGLPSAAPEATGGSGAGSRDRILLLWTGFSDAWGTDSYAHHPWLDAEAAKLIVDRGYRAVGLDALSVDPSTDHGPGGHGFPAHQILAGSGCVIIENLTGLERISQALADGSDVEAFLFPLNIPGADGAPIRAVARAVARAAARDLVALPAATETPGSSTAVLRPLSLEDVRNAAEELISSFAATDTGRYFSAFSPSATFIFHPEHRPLASRAAYRRLWDSWVGAGWKVLGCTSSEQNIQLLGEGAVFTHRVSTVVRTDYDGGTASSDERETIVFARDAHSGQVLAVHEHLSAVPPALEPPL